MFVNIKDIVYKQKAIAMIDYRKVHLNGTSLNVTEVFPVDFSSQKNRLLQVVVPVLSGDSWMYPYQRTPMGNPYISPIYPYIVGVYGLLSPRIPI